MAITIINQKPSNSFHPVANPINLTVNSTNSGNCNFRYICDIYINNVRVFRDKLFPDPTTGYGFFQIARIIQDYSDMGLPLSTQTDAGFYNISSPSRPNSMLSIYCKIGEEYDSSTDCTGSVIQYLSLQTTNTFYSFNGGLNYEDFPSFNFNDYLFTAGAGYTDTKFLTNSPRLLDIGFDDSYYLNFYSLVKPTSDINIRVSINYKDGSIFGVDIPVTIPMLLNTYKHYRIAVGPYNINKLILSGPLTITQWVDNYTIQIIDKGFGPIQYKTEIFTFKLKQPTKYKTRIGFVGLLGNTEYFTFFHKNKKITDIERKNFKKVLNSNYAGNWSYKVGDRSDTTYAINAQDKHTVASYVNRDCPAWLSDLYLSPEVWVQKGPKTLCFWVYPEVISGGGIGGGGVINDNQLSSRIGPVLSGMTRMLFNVGKDHGFKVGDKFYCYPDNDPHYTDYNNIFTIIKLVGDDSLDVGVTFGIYSLTNYVSGFIVKKEDWTMIPIVPTDGTLEEQQRGSKPFVYTLNYMNAYQKTTLR